MPSLRVMCAVALILVPGAASAFDAARMERLVTPFVLAVAAEADPAVDLPYAASGYAAIWTDAAESAAARRAALLGALSHAGPNGLGAMEVEADRLRLMLDNARNQADLGRVEAAFTRVFLDLARYMRHGVLRVADVAPQIKRPAREFDTEATLASFLAAEPAAYLADLRPAGGAYIRLAGARARLEAAAGGGEWGAMLRAGSDAQAIEMRLAALGYLEQGSGSGADRPSAALRAFQEDQGLMPDGALEERTLAALNVPARDRMGQILVAMERERWFARDPGARHIWVNLPEAASHIVVDGETAFTTRSVIGAHGPDRETPEFSHVMTHMVVNPSWYVPRSIITGTYLPGLRRNSRAHPHMEVIDRQGRVVPRSHDFSGYTARTFPFGMRQPPGPQNALGSVKFMFPNAWNIYLHDTNATDLFARPERAYSHGCIRLQDPHGFGRALLGVDGREAPGDYFDRHMARGTEARLTLRTGLPVHLVYRTAVAPPEGGMRYFADIYGRDARILKALRAAGVARAGAGS